jgi:hypothetical protein
VVNLPSGGSARQPQRAVAEQRADLEHFLRAHGRHHHLQELALLGRDVNLRHAAGLGLAGHAPEQVIFLREGVDDVGVELFGDGGAFHDGG